MIDPEGTIRALLSLSEISQIENCNCVIRIGGQPVGLDSPIPKGMGREDIELFSIIPTYPSTWATSREWRDLADVHFFILPINDEGRTMWDNFRRSAYRARYECTIEVVDMILDKIKLNERYFEIENFRDGIVVIGEVDQMQWQSVQAKADGLVIPIELVNLKGDGDTRTCQLIKKFEEIGPIPDPVAQLRNQQ